MSAWKFLVEKPCKLLLAIESEKKTYVHELSKEIDTTYAYTLNLVQELEKDGFLISEKIGRKKYVKLTEKGLNVSSRLKDFLNEIEEKPKEIDLKLKKYDEALERLSAEIKGKSLTKKEKAIVKRLLGRYKALIKGTKIRSKNSSSKKAELLKKIGKMEGKLRV
ncbi:MAG: hypothetical protein ACE5K4_02920 [Candidatus Hydrothermarchaeota archaeon]